MSIYNGILHSIGVSLVEGIRDRELGVWGQRIRALGRTRRRRERRFEVSVINHNITVSCDRNLSVCVLWICRIPKARYTLIRALFCEWVNGA